jgi:hypothetical protein
LEKFYKEDLIRILKEYYETDNLKYIIGVDDSDKDTLLTIMNDGLKKQELNTSLYNSINITEQALIHFSTNRKKGDLMIIFDENITVVGKISKQVDMNSKQDTKILNYTVNNQSDDGINIPDTKINYNTENNQSDDGLASPELISTLEEVISTPEELISTPEEVISTPEELILPHDDILQVETQFTDYVNNLLEWKKQTNLIDEELKVSNRLKQCLNDICSIGTKTQQFKTKLSFLIRQQQQIITTKVTLQKCLKDIDLIGEIKNQFANKLSCVMKRQMYDRERNDVKHKYQYDKEVQKWRFEKNYLDYFKNMINMSKEQQEDTNRKILQKLRVKYDCLLNTM